MLKKTQRLSRDAFTTLLATGKRVHGAHATLLYRRLPERASGSMRCACGVVVSKKTWKSAVVRHAVRRKVYEALRSRCERLDGVHFACILRHSAAGVPFEVVTTEIGALIDRTFFDAHNTPR